MRAAMLAVLAVSACSSKIMMGERRLQSSTVSSESELVEAVSDGAVIEVTKNITLGAQVNVTHGQNVAIFGSSGSGVTLSGGGVTRLFFVWNASLTLSSLTASMQRA